MEMRYDKVIIPINFLAKQNQNSSLDLPADSGCPDEAFPEIPSLLTHQHDIFDFRVNSNTLN